MKYIKYLIIVILSSTMFSENRDIMFESVKKYLAKYRYTIETNDLEIKNGIITLEISSRRTNINSQVLLGFYSIGRSLKKTNKSFNEIHIVIKYDNYNRNKDIIIAPIEIVKKLSNGKINSSQFFKIMEL